MKWSGRQNLITISFNFNIRPLAFILSANQYALRFTFLVHFWGLQLPLRLKYYVTCIRQLWARSQQWCKDCTSVPLELSFHLFVCCFFLPKDDSVCFSDLLTRKWLCLKISWFVSVFFSWPYSNFTTQWNDSLRVEFVRALGRPIVVGWCADIEVFRRNAFAFRTIGMG